MIVKRYSYQWRPTPDGAKKMMVQRAGWYLFGLIPLYIADL